MNIKDDQVYFIAEIGSNHNQLLSRTVKLIYGAKVAGFDAVKFQLFDPDKLYWPGIDGYEDIRDGLYTRNLELELLREAIDTTMECNIDFGLSVFDEFLLMETVGMTGIDFYKISSFDILRKEFILEVADLNKPMIVSLGYGLWKDFVGVFMSRDMLHHEAVLYIYNREIYTMHCISKYPATGGCNLGRIAEEKLDGWSDHTCESGVVHRAIGLGARMIEMHVDLDDMEGRESIDGHCWPMQRAADLIDDVRIGEKSMQPIDYPKYRSDIIHNVADPSDGLRPLVELR